MTPLLRSLLFVPGTNPDRFAKAIASGADGVVFDLEDGVDPSKKAEARATILAFLSEAPKTTAGLFVRVNASDSPWYAKDIETFGKLRSVRGIVLPKAEVPTHVAATARATATGWVIPTLETARGVLNAGAVVSAAGLVPVVLFGAEGLTAQLGIPRTIVGDELTFARSQVVFAATAVGADAIDTVLVDVTGFDNLRRDSARARALGFKGKMAIHPGQIPVIHEMFSPSPKERAQAQQIVEAFEKAQAQGEAVIRLGDKLIDMSMVVRAKRLLALKTGDNK